LPEVIILETVVNGFTLTRRA